MSHITSAQKSNTSATNTACVQLQSLNRENLPSSPGLIANGSINSVLNLAKDLRYVASGNWHLVDDGSNANFRVNMIEHPNTPTNSNCSKSPYTCNSKFPTSARTTYNSTAKQYTYQRMCWRLNEWEGDMAQYSNIY